jgi:radical SAM-linked protein
VDGRRSTLASQADLDIRPRTNRDRPEPPGVPQPVSAVAEDLTRKAGHYRVWYSKLGPAAFLSQLELQSVFERSLRRAGVAPTFSAGYHPLPLLSFGWALPVGVESRAEWFAVFLRTPLSPETFARLLAPALPEGLTLTHVEELPMGRKVPQPEAEEFSLRIREPHARAALDAWLAFAAASHFPFLRVTKKGTKTEDIRPLLESIDPLFPDSLRLVFSWREKYISPLKLVRAVCPDTPPEAIELVKTRQIFGGLRPPYPRQGAKPLHPCSRRAAMPVARSARQASRHAGSQGVRGDDSPGRGSGRQPRFGRSGAAVPEKHGGKLMLRKVILTVAAVILLAGAAAAGTGAPQVFVLKNGMTVAVVEDERFPLASVRLYVHAGSAYETPEQSGISHLLEHMVFKSTETREAGQAAKDIESAGGAVNAATSFDYTMYYADLPADRWLVGLEVIRDMIFGARFDQAELESEKKVVLSEIDRGRDNPQDVMFLDLQALVWPGTGYERPIIGSRERVSGFSGDDLRAYVTRWYQPQSMVLVVAGKVDAGEVLHKAEALFGDMKNDRTITPPMPLVRSAGARPEVRVEFGEWNKVYLGVAFPTPGMRAPQEAALEIFAQLLGGDETSRLYRRFKYEKRLVDEISASSMTLERDGILYIGATLDAAIWKHLRESWPIWPGSGRGLSTDREIDRPSST